MGRKELIISSILTILLLSGLIYGFNHYRLLEEDQLDQLLNNILEFSGIFSAILITFLISKVFQIRQEKLEIRREVIKLSHKITDFRRIARTLVNCYGFWNSDMRRKMDNEYRDLDLFTINDTELDENDPGRILKQRFYDTEINTMNAGWHLYLDMRTLVLGEELELFGKYDHDFIYPVELVNEWAGVSAGNNLWYCLIDKWRDYEHCFNFSAIGPGQQEYILSLAKKIDRDKYEGSKFDRDLLSDIGSDFAIFYFPKTRDLSYHISLGMPPSLLLLLWIFFSTMISGVIVPLVLTSLNISFSIKEFIAYTSISILVTTVAFLLIRFKRVLNDVVQIQT